MTAGSPPSTTATTELVVPRSMPITFAMSSVSPSVKCLARTARSRRRGHRRRLSAGDGLHHVDLDLLRLDLLDLRHADGEDTIPIARLDLVRLHRDRQGQGPLELPDPALPPLVAVLLRYRVRASLGPHNVHCAGNREADVLLVESGKVHRDHEVVSVPAHVDSQKPDPLSTAGVVRPTDEAVE